MKQKIIIPLAIFTFFILTILPAYAQGPAPLTAQVDRTTLSTDDILTLTVTVAADLTNLPQPMLPSLAGFNMVGNSTSTQISIVNGAINSTLVYNYQLQPNQTGALIIDPISLTLYGQTYTTQPITIQVTQGNGAPTAPVPAPSTRQTAPTSSQFSGQEVFAEAEVSNPNPYLGEQIIYTFRLYRVADMFDMLDQPYFEPPTFTGFWSEAQPEQSQYRVQAGGHIYNVTELSTILFPSKVGPITIEPAQITLPGGFFRSGSRLQTQPVTLGVKPLPADAPASFNGAVGQYTLSSQVDTTQTKVNEPVTWQITLSGNGNLKALPAPAWPDISGWRSFDSPVTVKVDPQGGQVGGSAIYERLLVPQQTGEYTLPPLEYSYFDPVKGDYQTIRTEPTAVSVAPGDGAVTQNIALVAADNKETVEPIATDIRHLKPAPAELSLGRQPITASPLYWLAWGVPLIGLVGHLAWKRREQYWQNNRSLARSSQAGKKARKSLVQLRQQGQDVYSGASQILTDYLADKLDQPVVGLTQPALAELLAEHGVPASLINRLQDCLASSELGRYAPGADQPDHARNLLSETDVLIRDFEQVL